MKIYSRILTLLCFCALLASCALEDGPEQGLRHTPLAIHANIGKETRALRSDSADQWSYVSFETGDKMGFYSPSGKWNGTNGNSPFVNEELIFNDEEQRFTGANGVEFSPTNIDGSKVLMYYPYDAKMDGTGMTLRTTKEDDPNTLRCIDLLDDYELTVMGDYNGQKTALFGSFQHAFAELIIMRGEGFDNPPKGKEQITAYLQDGFTNIQIVPNTEDGGWSCIPKLVYDPANEHGLTEEQAKAWVAWQGLNYGKTKDNTEGYEAWYVIVPTVGCEVGEKKREGFRSTVNYIELYDNEGELQRVYSLRLSGANTKFADAMWRYPMLIAMKELVPTANPVNIIPWNDDVNLTDERKRGINNVTEFAEWVKAYNAYLIDQSSSVLEEQLFKYGDLYIGAGDTKLWHFYILSDIDMDAYYSYISGQDGYSDQVVIPELRDILDGTSTTYGSNGDFLNYKVTNLKTTFIGTVTGTGQLQNLDFIEPDVRRSTTDPIGIISNNLAGTITNCNIENGNLVNMQGPAGFVAGSMTGGTISHCNLEGSLISQGYAAGEAKGVVGQQPTGDSKLENINATIISD